MSPFRPSKDSSPFSAQKKYTPSRTAQKRPLSPSGSHAGPTTPTTQRVHSGQGQRGAQTPSSKLTPMQKQKRLELIEAGLRSASQAVEEPSSQKHARAEDSPSSIRLAMIQAALNESRSTSLISPGPPQYVDTPPSQKRSRLQLDHHTDRSERTAPSLFSAPAVAAAAVVHAGQQTDTNTIEDEDNFWLAESANTHIPSNTASHRLPDIANKQRAPWQTPSPRRTSLESTTSSDYVHSMLSTSLEAGGSPTTGRKGGPSSLFGSAHPLDSPSKSNAQVHQSSPRTGWERIQADQAHPFHEMAASLRREKTQPAPSSSQDQVSADSLAAHVQSLQGAVEYIRKLERKQVANQKSIEAKSRRIAELEEALQREKSEKRYLEETLETLNTRR